MAFRVLIIGGTGQVGSAILRALVAEPFCAEVVMVNRRAIPPLWQLRFWRTVAERVATGRGKSTLIWNRIPPILYS